jgi:hypothetical protein
MKQKIDPNGGQGIMRDVFFAILFFWPSFLLTSCWNAPYFMPLESHPKCLSSQALGNLRAFAIP